MAKKYKNTTHKNPFREDRPPKPFPWIAFTIGALLVAAVVLGSVLLYNTYGSKIRKFTSDAPGDSYYDPRSGVTYRYSEFNSFQPTELEKGPYATCGEYSFYKIKGIDPKELIFATFLDDEEIPYGFFSIDGYEFPNPTDFKVVSASIHETEINSVAVLNLPKDAAASAMEIFMKSEGNEYPSNIDSDSIMDVYFYSENYSQFSYVIKFFKTMSGDRYLSDSATDRHVIIPDGVLSDYFPED